MDNHDNVKLKIMCLMNFYCFKALDVLQFIHCNNPSSADLALKPVSSTLPDYLFIDFYDDDLFESAQRWSDHSTICRMNELFDKFSFYFDEATEDFIEVQLLNEAGSICITVHFTTPIDIAIFTLYFDVCTK